MPLLEVSDLVTHFRTAAGRSSAPSTGVAHVERGEALGIVGESGSGKTVLSRSIMGLLSGPRRSSAPAPSASTATSSSAPPTRQLRSLWGTEMAMVFQDPMSSLNPLMRVGEQIAEPLRATSA